MIRALPVAVLAGAGRFTRSTATQAGTAAAEIARMTHNHPGVEASSFIATLIAVSCLREPERFDVALHRSLKEVDEFGSLTILPIAIELGRSRPADLHTLREIAPDDTAESVLAGAIYVGSSYPDWRSANQALALARVAPDGDGVAALTGAFLGAVNGYEVFPSALLNRLDLGWTLDRLAIDLALEVREDQVSASGWKEGGSPRLEPWWDAKYPGL
jgi:ADP-ribosylglycohydrolase